MVTVVLVDEVELGDGVAIYRMTHPTAATAAGVTLLKQQQQNNSEVGYHER